MKTIHTLKDAVAKNQVESLSDTDVKVNDKALDCQIAVSEAEVKDKKLCDTS